MLEELNRLNVDLVLAAPGRRDLDTTSPLGRIAIHLNSILDEYYAEDISQRAKESVQYRKRRSISIGKPPFGTIRGENRYLQPSPHGAWLLPSGKFIEGTRDERPEEGAIWRGYYDCAHLILTTYAEPEGERADMLRVIDTKANQLDKMVGNLLDISRLQAGAMPINAIWNSLEEVAGDVAARTWQLTQQERIEICFPDAFPLVRFDYGLMLQALSNVVDNALRYEPFGRKVEVCGEFAGNEPRLVVRNHGPNFPIEEQARLFEPFHPGAGGNIGLGLAIAKGIVEAHGGRLWVEDTPGGGATFVFALPSAEVREKQ